MSKYFDTKPGSLEEAVSAAQQAAIAISKKEKGEKPKDKKDEGNAFGAALMAAKEKGEKTFTVAGKTYDVKTEEDKLEEGFFSKEYEPGQYVNGDEAPFVNAIKRAGGKNIDVQKPTRRDPMLTIEFEGDVKKAKKEVSKVGDGTEEIDEKLGKNEELDPVNKKAVKKKFDDRKDKDIDNDGDVDSTDKYLHKRRKAISKSMGESLMSVADSVRQMWDEAAKKSESQDVLNDKDGDGMDDDQKPEKAKAKKMTDTGKPVTPIETSPKMPKTKNEKNKV
tara:strand:- start:4103 stop:4936 length:834 start_codon:yes stop_codon:yes gene_type:complete